MPSEARSQQPWTGCSGPAEVPHGKGKSSVVRRVRPSSWWGFGRRGFDTVQEMSSDLGTSICRSLLKVTRIDLPGEVIISDVHVPGRQIVSTELSHSHVVRAWDAIQAVRDDMLEVVRTGAVPASPGGGCRWCPYRSICPKPSPRRRDGGHRTDAPSDPAPVGGFQMEMSNKLLMRVEEAAGMLSISRAYMYQLLGKGAVDSVHIGRSRRVAVAALHAYVACLATSCSSRPWSPADLHGSRGSARSVRAMIAGVSKSDPATFVDKPGAAA